MNLLLLLVMVTSVSAWQLTLLHVNDIHVRMEETNKFSARCKEKDKSEGKCYGGLARLHRAVSDIRHKEDNVLWLNAGDFFQGTIWYTQFKWRVVSQFNNLLDFDAMTLGNHEFDDSVSGLVPFLANQSCPVIVSNMNTSLVPQLDGLYVGSLIKEISGHRVGLVGYLTPQTADISNPGNVVFTDEVQALKTKVAALKQKGVDIIIAIGHSGYKRDLEIAKAVPELDVIVGGHSHSFLYSPTDAAPNPSTNTIRGPYPTLVEHQGGSPTLVVQAYAFTKYLGHVKLEFSAAGGLEGWTGAPILLNSDFQQDPDIEAALVPWRQQLASITGNVVGSAAIPLHIYRDREATLGNWVADVMVGAWAGKAGPGGGPVHLALVNSGGVRSSLDQGNITMADLLSTFPFQNTFDVVTLLGRDLGQALEHSVENMGADGSGGEGRFLQVSGLKILYDLRKHPGSRVVDVQVLGAGGEYSSLEEDSEYSVVITNYVAGGGDGYRFEEWKTRDRIIGSLDTEVLESVLTRDSPISSRLEGRIRILTGSSESTSRAREGGGKPQPAIAMAVMIAMTLIG